MNAALTLAGPVNTFPFEPVIKLVLDAVRSPNSRRAYTRALLDFMCWYGEGHSRVFNKATVNEYRAELDRRRLSASSINLRLSAIRKLAAEAADNGLLASGIAEGIARVKGAASRGVRSGHWLGRVQAQELIERPDKTTMKGARDRAILALLIGCGLRRNELVTLTFEHIQQRDGRWIIADLVGKGGRTRTIPMPAWAKKAVEDWAVRADLRAGRIIRAVSKTDQVVGVGVTPQAVFNIVRGY